MSLANHYSELKDEPELKIWDGDITKIPEKNTLISFSTSSSGLVNGVVTGYHLKWREKGAQIRISLRHPNSSTKNERMMEDLQLPMTNREKSLLEKSSAT
jgi:hypothetical protein